MTVTPNYQKTLRACYLGYVTQAICANFAPLLFLTFHKTYDIFVGGNRVDTQRVFSDTTDSGLCCRGICGQNRISCLRGDIPSVIGNRVGDAGIFAGAAGFAVSGNNDLGCDLCGRQRTDRSADQPYCGSLPFENKESRMSLLHSFYCWGMVGVVLGSTVFFALFGLEKWRVLTLLWAIVPFCNIFNFLTCPIERLVKTGEGIGAGKLLRLPVFWLLILLMACAGAAENSMAQWASAFTEAAMGISKPFGDLAGPCLFAGLMGAARVLCARISSRVDLRKIMLLSGILCMGCYLLTTLAALPALGMAGCALCGFFVGIMWPGTLSISSQICLRRHCHVCVFGSGRRFWRHGGADDGGRCF